MRDTRNCTRDSDDPLACIVRWSVQDRTYDSSNRQTGRPPAGEVLGGLTITLLPYEELSLQYNYFAPITFPLMPISRKQISIASQEWNWTIYDWPPGENTTIKEHSMLMIGGASMPLTMVALITNPKTLREDPEVITRQMISNELWKWNHSVANNDAFWGYSPFSQPRKYGVPGMDRGSWSIQRASDYQERSSLPPRRYGAQFVYLRGGKSAMLFGGFSTVCADYCKDLWEFHQPENRWSYKNMTPASSINALYVTKFDTQQRWNLSYWRNPAKRYMHTMTAKGDDSLMLFGGFYASKDDSGWLNDVWEYKLRSLPQTVPCQHYDVGETAAPPLCADQHDSVGYWLLHHNGTHRFRNSDGSYNEEGVPETGAVNRARRGHAAAFANNKLFVFGGQVLDPYNVSETKGRTKYHRSRIIGDVWEWDYATGLWRDITALATRRDGLPSPRYSMAFMTYKDHLIIHGGYQNPEFYDDMWSFNTTTVSWIRNSYSHRNQLYYLPRPFTRKGHAIGFSGENFVLFGGVGQSCELIQPGNSPTAPAFCMNDDQKPSMYFGDTWLWGHTTCPHGCSGHGVCNIGFCICEQGLGSGHWGYHCGYKMCHNSTCAWDYATQHEYCEHCQSQGFCEGFAGRCHCDAGHQHILPKFYNDLNHSRYGPNLTRVTTAPVPFYAEDPDFHMDERRRKDCLYYKCPHQFCSGHGYCMPNGTCHCQPDYIGTGCEYHAHCPNYCNFAGLCEPKLMDPTMPWVPSASGDCKCFDPFNGSTCQIAKRNSAYAVGAPRSTILISGLVLLLLLLLQ